MKGKLKYLILFAVTLFIVGLDQWTKGLVVARFRLGESIPILDGLFSLTYVRNTGAAFGLLAGAHPAFRVPFFVIVPMIALIAIGLIFRKLPAADKKLSTALSLVIGGAVGNLIDRLALGYVVDFLDFHWKYLYHFPAFNVADAAICVGVGILMLDLLTQETLQKKESSSDVSSSR
ncbi:signal peptidase II [Bdellovibrionota bacterium FG-2]